MFMYRNRHFRTFWKLRKLPGRIRLGCANRIWQLPCPTTAWKRTSFSEPPRQASCRYWWVQPVPVCHHPLCEKLPPIFILNLPCLSLKPFPLVLSLSALVISCTTSSLYAPFKFWKATMKSPQSLLFSKEALCSPGHIRTGIWESPTFSKDEV